jgi:Zn-finger nucleic acid-binding protein
MPPDVFTIRVDQIKVTKAWGGGLKYAYPCPKCREDLVSNNDQALTGDRCPRCSTPFVFAQELRAAWRKYQDQRQQEDEAKQRAQAERQQRTAEQRAAATQTATRVAASAVNTVRSQFDAVRRGQFADSTSILDIFDWRFKKYLTPWILRVTWLFILFVTALWVAGNLFDILSSWLPEMEWASNERAIDRRDVSRDFGPAKPILPGWLIDLMMRCGSSIARTMFGIAQIAAGAIMLLLLRVFFEVAIVLFNIATTLTTIETDLRSHARSDAGSMS